MTDIIIRPYRINDQAAVLEIAADTAYFGEPVEAFLEDRTLYGDAFARYYTEYEAPYAWVAESSGGVIGFLLGCVDTAQQAKEWRRYILRKVLINATSGRYTLGRLTAGFSLGMFLGAIRGEDAKVDLGVYPAHLQIDVRQGYRGLGVGRQLIEAYLEQLRGMSIAGIHLETTSHNEAACLLYEKVGLQILDSRLNRFWSKKLGFAVENRSYGMKFV